MFEINVASVSACEQSARVNRRSSERPAILAIDLMTGYSGESLWSDEH
jgi:hypothetical protein